MPTLRRTILMIHPGGLGDVLLAVPAMVRLRTHFPHHRLLLCAEDQVAKLLLAYGIVDAWTSVHGPHCAGLFAGTGSATGQVRTWLDACDLAVGWIQDLDEKLTQSLQSAGVRKVIVRSPFSAEIGATHQRDRFLEAINEAPFNDEKDVLLTVTAHLRCLGQSWLEAAGLSIRQPLIVIHPGSGSIHKCVASEILASVVVALQSAEATPLVLEGPADRKPVEHLLRLCVNPPIVLRGLDIITVAGVVAQAQLFVGHDSGVTHMAGLMGVHTVALFGPTDPARWAPWGPHVAVVQGAPCRCQSWTDVGQCENKPCLNIAQDHLVAVCLARLKEAVIRREFLSRCLVTDYPVC